MQQNVENTTTAPVVPAPRGGKPVFRSRRMRIRFYSYIIAIFAVVAGFAAMGWYQAYAMRMRIEYSYQRALNDLELYVGNIDVALQKSLYAGTPEQAVTMSAKVWREAGAAKACLASLPYTDTRLSNTQKFLSQVGEFAYSLSRRAASGEAADAITEEERNTLKQLSGYANTLTEELAQMMNEVAAEDYSMGAINDELQGAYEPDDTDGPFAKLDGTFEEYPMLIYDGPFSDHLETGEALVLKDKPEVSQEQALQAAADFLGLPADKLQFAGMQEGRLPCYEFTGEGYSISITKQGGYVDNMNLQHPVSESNYGVQQALDAAAAFLASKGLPGMKETYYLEAQGQLIINYAWVQDGAVCYTDLVKVSVAMDDLSIIGYEGRGFLMMHKDREIPEEILTPEQALESVSRYLTVQNGQMAFISPGGLTEYYVYEFQCVAEDGQQVLVYVDAKNGREVDILLLLDTPGGTLTM